MTLDVFTLRVAAGAVVLMTAVLFVLQAWDRRGQVVDRLWMLALASALTTTLVTAVEELGGAGQWWLTAVSNGTTVLVPWAIWSGARAGAGRRPLTWGAVAAAAVTALAALATGPQGGTWAGGAVYLAATTFGCLAAGSEVARGPLGTYRSGTGLAAVLLLCGAFFGLRLLLFLAVGPQDPLFDRLAGVEISTLVLLLLVEGAALFMVALRGDQGVVDRPGTGLFDPLTGALPAWAVTERAEALLSTSARRGMPVCLLRVRLDDIDAIRTGFGRSQAEAALGACGEALRLVAPPGTLVGLDQDRSSFEVVLDGADAEQARTWAEDLRAHLGEVPVVLPDGRLRLVVSVGLACTADHGYHLPELRNLAARSLEHAQRAGGDQVATLAEG